MRGGGSTTYFDQLGLHRLIALVPDPAELRAFAHDVLGPLAEPGGAELRETLQVLLDANFNLAEAARQQFFHYNTMRYRVGQARADARPALLRPAPAARRGRGAPGAGDQRLSTRPQDDAPESGHAAAMTPRPWLPLLSLLVQIGLVGIVAWLVDASDLEQAAARGVRVRFVIVTIFYASAVLGPGLRAGDRGARTEVVVRRPPWSGDVAALFGLVGMRDGEVLARRHATSPTWCSAWGCAARAWCRWSR